MSSETLFHYFDQLASFQLDGDMSLAQHLQLGIPIFLPNSHVVKIRLESIIGLRSTAHSIEIFPPDGKKTLAYCGASLNPHRQPRVAKKFCKKYLADAPVSIQGQGLITFCSSLLFQIFRDKGAVSIEGAIRVDNTKSFATRLAIRDVFTGEYFTSEILATQLELRDYFLVSTNLTSQKRNFPQSYAHDPPRILG